MEGTKFCPVIKADCKKEQCAWWDKYIEECSVLSIMLALWADVDEDEDEEDDEEEKDEEEKDEDEEEIDNDKDGEFEDGEVIEFKVKIKRLD
ncbi:hypothetical protein ACOBQJ_05125 [Pelotomaculum propionicicum]|uniref:hypothetical protein n=1 Tax=Pelotomaculum propionicicum TaxID=258475 RepID=UPI003B81D464